MKARVAKAFAPATITNFFAVHYDKARDDLLHAGATGGGYLLSEGAISKVTAISSRGRSSIGIIVNGDPNYDARTTRAALDLLLKHMGRTADLTVEQQVNVPIGFGFGASAASALSAAYAASAALGLRLRKEQVACFAHEAEILQQTGLGTVSAAYDGVGAGVVYEPGAPGVAKFMNVRVPRGVRIVTAALSTMQLRGLLSSRKKISKLTRLGTESLARVIREPTLNRMAEEGQEFTRKLGMTSPDVRSLVRIALSAGANYASQNMVGQAVHAVVPKRLVPRVVKALKASALMPRVDVFALGSERAGVISVAELRYPTATSSLV